MFCKILLTLLSTFPIHRPIIITPPYPVLKSLSLQELLPEAVPLARVWQVVVMQQHVHQTVVVDLLWDGEYSLGYSYMWLYWQMTGGFLLAGKWLEDSYWLELKTREMMAAMAGTFLSFDLIFSILG